MDNIDNNDAFVLTETDLPLPLFNRGKVRDSYDLGNQLLIISTDRISALDVVLPSGIPHKGVVLNQLSIFWFRHTQEIVPNHLLEMVDDSHCLDSYRPSEENFECPSYLPGRSMIVKKLNTIPVECVVRGYLAGSAWAEYKEKGTVSGIEMPKGLQESQELSQPIFTPTTKEKSGHDKPITINEMIKIVGEHLAKELEEKSIALYQYAREYARNRDIIIADTKFEFGTEGSQLVLIDEVLTPDSSRLWDATQYKVGQSQPSFDKQPVRDWLAQSGWNMEAPPPVLPIEIVHSTTARYIQAYEKLTGRKFVIPGTET
jgi:phosphoribosylaminoimidazole-succinocarboxamide synthase